MKRIIFALGIVFLLMSCENLILPSTLEEIDYPDSVSYSELIIDSTYN